MNRPPSTARRAAEAPTRIDVRYRSRRAALSAGKTDGSKLQLFVATRSWVPPGAPVLVCIAFGDSERRFEIDGTALGQVPAMASTEPGMTVEFQGDGKRTLAGMLAFCADRPAAMGTALRERVKVDLRCKVKMSYGRIGGRVLDLSRSGAFVASSHTLKGLRPGATLRLALVRNWLGFATRWLDAVVVWRGEKQGKAGFAVRFQFQHNEGMEILGHYLKKSD